MEKSLVLVKPDATRRELGGAIIARFQAKGLKLVALKMLKMDVALAKKHYAVHADKPFFNSLVEYITSGTIIAMVLKGENAIALIRETAGATNPSEAAPGTIRADFGESIESNAVHASDGVDTARHEISLFFDDKELYES
jgi:nucleoside-diphosphate kinase